MAETEESLQRPDQASVTRETQTLSEILRNRAESLNCLSNDEIAAQEAREEKNRRNETMRRLIASAGKRFSEFTLTSWKPAGAKQSEAKSAAIEWARTFPERKKTKEGLVLYGPVGTGKDHLAFGSVGFAVKEFGCTAEFCNGRDLVSEIRDRIGAGTAEKSLMDKLCRQDVLILSDPLPVKGELSDFQADSFYRLVEWRDAEGLLTVCTLNVADNVEADRRLGSATWDRLCDRAWKIACFWASFRKPARDIGG